MGSRIDRLLSGEAEQTQGSSRIDRLLSGHDPHASAGTEAVGSVTTEITPGGDAPGFGTQLKAATIDDPVTKLKLYAKARFPNEPPEVREARYGIHQGEVVYQTDDGKLMRETPATFMDNFTRGVAEGTSRLPADVGAVIGAWLGTVSGVGPAKGAMAGAATGAQVRKAVGRYLGEEQTVGENIKDMAIEGAMAGVGELGGAAVGRASDAYQAYKGGVLGKAAGRDALKMNPVDIAKAEADFAKHGIDPYPPQTTMSEALTQKWEALEGLPRTADTMRKAKAKQGPQVQQAIQNFIEDLGPGWTTDRAGKETVAAARKSIDKLERARAIKVKPLYDKAYETAPPIDIREVEELVDTMLAEAPSGGTGERALKKVQKMLYEVGKEAPTAEGTGGKATQVLVTSARKLDRLKKEIDFMLEGPDAASIQGDTLRQLAIVKNKLVGLMDDASPEYRAARQMWQDLDAPIKARKDSLIGEVARTTDANVQDAARKLFKSTNTPGQVAHARHFIRKQNPEAWDAAVKTYLLDHFDRIKLTTRGLPNVAGRVRDLWIGNEQQRKILHAAMGDKQFDNLMEFGNLMERVSYLFRKESQTIGKGEYLAEMKKEGSNAVVGLLETDISRPLQRLGAWWNDILQGNYMENLANAMVDPGAAAKLKKMKKLNPKSREFMKRFGAFIGADVGGQISAETPPDFAPSRQ